MTASIIGLLLASVWARQSLSMPSMSAWLRPACLAFWAFTASITVLSAAHCFTVDLANSVTGATCASLAQAAVANSVPAMPETIPFRRLDEEIGRAHV